MEQHRDEALEHHPQLKCPTASHATRRRATTSRRCSTSCARPSTAPRTGTAPRRPRDAATRRRALAQRPLRAGRRRRVLERQVVLAQRAAGKDRARGARRRPAHHRPAGDRHQSLDRHDHRAFLRDRGARHAPTSRTAATERVPIDGLARFVAIGGEAKLHDATAREHDAPTLVRVGVGSPFLANGFVVADTPGLASINPAHRRATLALSAGRRRRALPDRHATAVHRRRRSVSRYHPPLHRVHLHRADEDRSVAHRRRRARDLARRRPRASSRKPPCTRRRTPVFPLSAREYAEGLLTGDAALIERSRFLPIPERARRHAGRDDRALALARAAAATARRLARRAADAWRATPRRSQRAPAGLAAERAALEPRLAELDAATARAARSCSPTGAAQCEPDRRARDADARRARAHARCARFDVADIARLRDRAKLHGIVDATVAGGDGALRRRRHRARDRDVVRQRTRCGRRVRRRSGERRVERRPRDRPAQHDRARRAGRASPSRWSPRSPPGSPRLRSGRT